MREKSFHNSERRDVFRGEVWYANLGEARVAGIQAGLRPVLILQNNTGNTYSPTTIVAPITSVYKKMKMPTHVETYINKPSVIQLEQITTITKDQLVGTHRVGKLTRREMMEVHLATVFSLDLFPFLKFKQMRHLTTVYRNKDKVHISIKADGNGGGNMNLSLSESQAASLGLEMLKVVSDR